MKLINYDHDVFIVFEEYVNLITNKKYNTPY